jgi:hypothetical protein
MPVTPTTANIINNNLKSAEPPKAALTQYPGSVRPGNSYQNTPGVREYTNSDTNAMRCVSGGRKSRREKRSSSSGGKYNKRRIAQKGKKRRRKIVGGSSAPSYDGYCHSSPSQCMEVAGTCSGGGKYKRNRSKKKKVKKRNTIKRGN